MPGVTNVIVVKNQKAILEDPPGHHLNVEASKTVIVVAVASIGEPVVDSIEEVQCEEMTVHQAEIGKDLIERFHYTPRDENSSIFESILYDYHKNWSLFDPVCILQ